MYNIYSNRRNDASENSDSKVLLLPQENTGDTSNKQVIVTCNKYYWLQGVVTNM